MAPDLRQLPNLITTARILMVPVVIWLILKGMVTEAFWVFLLAGFSDGLDGWIAKRFDAKTELGAWLDPIADKLLIAGTFIALGWQNLVPAWLVMLVASRDVLIMGAVMLGQTMGQPFAIAPSRASKINTAAQIGLALMVMAMAAMILPGHGPTDERHWRTVTELLMLVVAGTTLTSGAGYLGRWLSHARTHDHEPHDDADGRPPS